MEKGQYEMAMKEFQGVLTKDPRNWETYAYLGEGTIYITNHALNNLIF
jgi:Flp pilus assembly protein TadD